MALSLKMKQKHILSRLPNTAFLCGANTTSSMRSQFLNYVKSYHKHIFISGEVTKNIFSDDKIIIAEQVEELWEKSLREANTGYDNLLEFEMDIAELASVIPIFLEGPGAMVETGAFFINPKLRKKLLIFIDKKKYGPPSFIRRAIIDPLIRSQQIVFYDQNEPCNNKIFFQKIFKFREREYPINTQEDNLTSLYFFLLKILCDWKTEAEIIEELNKKNEFKNYKETISNYLKVLVSFGLIIKEPEDSQINFLSLIRNDISNDSSILKQIGTQTKSDSILLKYMKKFTMEGFSYKYTYHDTSEKSQKKIKQRQYKQPEKQLQVLQKILKTRILSNEQIFCIHEVATAYKKGINIKENTEKHLGNQYILRLDFKCFFDSIRRSDFLEYLKDRDLYPEYRDLICDIVFRDDSIENKNFSLPTGASTSPVISNILLYFFDKRISKYCHSLGITYTRYADDLTFSHNEPDKLKDIESQVRGLLKEIPYLSNLQINNNKTLHMSKKGRRKITGLYLTPEGKISIGRNKKNYIKKLLRDYEKEENTMKLSYIQGHLLFIKSVEKDFWDRLYNKYGNNFRDLFYPQKTFKIDNSEII